MRSSIVCGLIASGVLVGAALAAEQRPVEPGGKIAAMTVVRGDAYNADENMWVACPVWVSTAGKYHRSCSVPKVARLYIGAAWAGPTKKELDREWKQEHWSLWVDGRAVDLPRFGTSDGPGRTPNGTPVLFRRWRVILAGAPTGKHTIHYLSHLPSGAVNTTLAVTIEK
jgi:hypothetical protein